MVYGLSEKLRRIGDTFNIRTVFKMGNTLRSILTKTKLLNQEKKSKNRIYSFPCECIKIMWVIDLDLLV